MCVFTLHRHGKKTEQFDIKKKQIATTVSSKSNFQIFAPEKKVQIQNADQRTRFPRILKRLSEKLAPRNLVFSSSNLPSDTNDSNGCLGSIRLSQQHKTGANHMLLEF